MTTGDGDDSGDSDDPADGDADGSTAAPTDAEVVEAAATAAEDLVFSRLDASDVEDLDVSVSFVDGTLDVDVYLHAPEALADVQQVADDAALAARAAVDDLLE